MKTIKVTFEDGHILNYKGSTDDDELWDLITAHSMSNGGYLNIITGYDSCVNYKIEVI